jgi:elongation factor Ts
MSASTELIKELRQSTGAGVLECKKALDEAGGDMEKAAAILHERGLDKAAKKADRATEAGLLDLYSHGEGRVGVMIEVDCETDFVARTDEFREFAHEMALQVAAKAPRWVRPDEIPEDIVAERKAAFTQQALDEGKPDDIVERIVEGRLAKFYDENCLLGQAYIREDSKTVEELLKETVAAIGENIQVRRFVRWEVAEPIE